MLDVLKLGALFGGGAVGTVLVCVGGSRLFPPPPPAGRFDSPYVDLLLRENHQLRTEAWRLKCQVLDLRVAGPVGDGIRDQVEQDKFRRGATRIEPAADPAADPGNLIPPQTLIVPPQK